MGEEPVPGGDRPPTDVDGADAFVGRVAELRRLDETYRQADRAGGHAVLVTGVRGVGKTTLVEAFLDRLAGQREPPLVGTGRCVAGVTPPYHAFRQVFDDLPAGPGEVFDDTDGLPVDDVDGARQRRRGMFADVGDRLHTLAADRPLVLVFEDLHSADPATLFLLEYLVEAVTGWTSPVLVLVTARVGVTDRAEELAEAGDPARTVEVGLDSLDRDDVRGLLEHLLDVEQVSQTALDRVYDHTGGNPLFVREVSRTLAAHSDTGPLPEDTLTDWGVDHVSATVERAVTDRIEACSAPDRALLELGAVLGETVSLPVLVAASERPAAAVRESADRLLDRQLWERTDDAVTFVHGVVRDQLRDQLDGERRVACHRRAAEAIETVYTDTPDRQYGRLGEHYEAADRPRQAIRWYRQAGERALGVYGHEAAVESYQRALELARTHDVLDSEELAAVYAEVADALWTTGSPATAAEHASEGLAAAPERSRVRCRLLDIRANAESNRGEYYTAERLSRSQRELAADLPAPVFEAKAHRRLGALARRHGEYDRAREQYRVALDIARETENRVLESRVLLGIGGIAYHQSRFETAHEYATRSRAIVQELGDRRQEARVLNFLGAVASSRDEYDRARSYYRRCLDIDGRFGDRHRQARVLNNLGLAARQEGDYDEARRHYEQSLDIARELDDNTGMAYSRHNLGEVAVYRGDSDRAREQLRHSLETVREHGDGRVEVANLVRLGDCERVARSFDRAVERYQEGLALARERGFSQRVGDSHRGLGLVACHREEYEQAREHLQEALSTHETIDNRLGVGVTRLALARLALGRGEPDRAGEQAKLARDSFEELGATHRLGRCHETTGSAAARRDDPAAARDYWEQARERFETVTATHDELRTLERLVESYRGQDDDRARHWCRRAQAVVADAPDAVVANYGTWVDPTAAALDLS